MGLERHKVFSSFYWKTFSCALAESFSVRCRYIFNAIPLVSIVVALNFIVHWNLNKLGQENGSTGKENAA